MSQPEVRHWTNKRGADHYLRRAECGGIVFEAFPHHTYYARLGDVAAVVGDLILTSRMADGQMVPCPCYTAWIVRLLNCLPGGKNTPRAWKKFEGEMACDDAFRWAADNLQNPDKLEKPITHEKVQV